MTGRKRVVFTTNSKVPEPKIHVGFRIKKSLADYLEERAGGERGVETKIVEEALLQHRTFFKRLSPMKAQLAQLALDEGLEWPTDENELYLRLIERALEKPKKK